MGMSWWRSSNRRVDGTEPAAEALEAGGRRGEGGGIAVDAEDQQVGAAVEQGLGVAAAAERGVEDDPGGAPSAKAATISSTITGRCTKASVIAVPPSRARRGSSLLLPSGRWAWWS